MQAYIVHAAIDLLAVSAVYIDFATARVNVEEFNIPGLISCTRDIIFQAVPTSDGVSPPSPIRGGDHVTFHNLNFCSTNYTFQLTPVSINDVNGSVITTNAVSGNKDGELYTL